MVLSTAEDSALMLAEYELAKDVATQLDKIYPNHLWMVTVQGGVTYVRNMALEGKWGFILHNNKLDDVRKAAVLAGGELLERFKISRSKPGADQARDFLQERMQQSVLKLPEWVK